MKRFLNRFSVLALCFCLLFSASAPAEAVKTATVSGMVAGMDGLGLVAQVVFTGDAFLQRVNTDMLGRFSLKLPLGDYTLEITKGSAYERSLVPMTVSDRKAKCLGTLPLHRLYATDWIAGDLHQHSVYSFDGKNSPAEIVLSNLSMGLSFGVLTDHNDLRGNAEFVSATLDGFLPIAGVEVTTDRGHYNALGQSAAVDWSVINGAADIRRIADAIHQQGALAQINHPTRMEFAFVDWDLAGLFDTIEIWNGKSVPPYVEGEPNRIALQTWFSLLNQGLYLPATAGSDNHDIDGNLLFQPAETVSPAERYWMTSMYSGMPRTYVYAAAHTTQAVLDAIRAGHSFLTNNPLAYLEVNGRIPGETAAAGSCDVHIRLQSNRPLTEVRLIRNGAVWQDRPISGLEYEATVSATLESGDWIVLEVLGENGDYAISNPVFIQ